MSTSDSLKRQRTSAKGRFTRVVNNLEHTLAEESCDINVVSYMFEDVDESRRNVNEKHDKYMSSITATDEELNAGDNWITEIQKRFYEIRNRLHKKKYEEKLKITMENAKRVRNFAYSNFCFMYSNINKLIEQNCPVVSIERERTVILQQFTDVKKLIGSY